MAGCYHTRDLLWRFALKSVSKKGIARIKTVSSRCLSVGSQLRKDKDALVDQKLLEILVCPLSKKPLRYDGTTNELISDEIGVAFPIQNGIPNLIPHDGRLPKKDNIISSKLPSSKDK